MGLFCEFDVIDDFGYLDETEEYQIAPDYSEGNETFVKVFLSTSRDLVPVDTGYLQSTLAADTDGDSYCYCETDCEYAQYVEYGTYKMDAQPYFEPAIEAALAAAKPLWDRAEQDALAEEEALAAEEEEEAEMEEQEYSDMGDSGGADTLGGFVGGILASLIVAFVIVTVQVAFGADFSSRSSGGGSIGGRGGGAGGYGAVFMPDIEIT